MDNKKIGKLIAELRKKKGMTQQELGDIVGVGFRAVSKWERGITLPDITLINELSKILGITSDELLSGELNKENKAKPKNKNLKKIIKILIPAIILISIASLIFVYYNNKTYTYNISSTSDKYNVRGKIIVHEDDVSILINELVFLDEETSSIKIKNYEYMIFINEKLVLGFGINPNDQYTEQENTIGTFAENFRINYDATIDLPPDQLENGKLKIKVIFYTEENQEITQEINSSLKLIK